MNRILSLCDIDTHTHTVDKTTKAEEIFTVLAGPQSEFQDLQGAEVQNQNLKVQTSPKSKSRRRRRFIIVTTAVLIYLGRSDSEALWENMLFCENVLLKWPSAMRSGIQMHRSRYKMRCPAFIGAAKKSGAVPPACCFFFSR